MAIKMDRIIRHISGKLVEKLPKKNDTLTPDDLYELDIPRFVTERVVFEMHQNLRESISFPDSEWADLSDPDVQAAWKEFLEAVGENLRMPSSFAASLFEAAVADTLYLATQPRESIPNVIFKSDKALTFSQLKQRSRYVNVNRHLVKGLVLYMERKKKKTLSSAECKFIIEKIDQKLTKNYNSLNWAQMLEPVFMLTGPDVDSDLFRVFFEDKGLNRFARKFDVLDSSINRAQFIEVLSSPDLLNLEGYEKEDSNLFDFKNKFNPESDPAIELSKKGSKAEKKEDETGNKTDRNVNKADEIAKKELEKAKLKLNQVARPEPDSMKNEEEEVEDSILNSFHKWRSKSGHAKEPQSGNPDLKQEESESDNTTLHRRFIFDSEAINSKTDEGEDSPRTLYEELRLKRNYIMDDNDNDDDEQSISNHDFVEPEREEAERGRAFVLAEDEDEDDVDNELLEVDAPDYNQSHVEENPDKAGEIEEEGDEDEGDAPIWQSFLEREDLSNYSEVEDEDKAELDTSDQGENVDDDGFLDEPIIDLTKGNLSSPDKNREIAKWLRDDEARFVTEIFGGSDAAYEQALDDIYEFENWKNAARYIEKEIFARNFVDVYEEVAVDFTDRLHTFFKEIK